MSPTPSRRPAGSERAPDIDMVCQLAPRLARELVLAEDPMEVELLACTILRRARASGDSLTGR